MMLHVIEARYVRGYTLWVKFSDGTSGEVDLANELWGELFKPLHDVDYFKKFRLELHTVAWPNGADFAPEFLHDHVRVTA